MNLDDHILKALQSRSTAGRPLTISDFARQFGVSRQVVATAAGRLVDDGLAAPSMVMAHGTPTLHGLLPHPVGAAKQ
jgi:hypothetical protein